MADPEEQPTLQMVVERAVGVVPGCDFASVSLRRRRGRVETTASTSDLASRCDALQYQLEEGPCLEAVWDGDSYLAEDIGADPRWPRWGPRVAELGVGSVLAIRLSTEAETLGALNLYATKTHAFSADDVDIASIFTVHATNALLSARLVSGLQTAVQSRHLIGVAQGILMATYQLTLDQSFELLRRYSSQSNTKIREVAQHVVERGGLPTSNSPDPAAHD
jgi:GAF domain-containing protein